MKNFNIEDLKRETPYKTPENFFAEMQENVFKNIGGKTKKAPIFALRRLAPIAAAASLLVAGGLGFLWFGENQVADSPKNHISAPAKVTAAQVQPSEQAVVAKIEHNNSESVPQDAVDYSSAIPQKKSEKTEPQAEAAVSIADNTAAEADFDNALAKFTPEEIKQATENADKDVYLDLYN